ncbi:unnamed protein product [Rotaria sp. Silwood1]|nr:unnamed protein product [Rotaria sp. Silwood1]CAF1566618.1 unnamed protein product [Rotaria sp. Silwood1]CAF3669146.1 unnamed protein product [Rotaria sp. Silwood1]CAF4731462.1 unnamed protein product [Rotaria sp. Silwood1]CAF4783187.1 unnamed protein product [Rotaria sp. Silwood1]
MKNRNVIKELVSDTGDSKRPPIVGIKINNYNITKITNEYINSTLNVDFPQLEIEISFDRLSTQAPLTVENDFFSIGFKRLYILVACHLTSGLIKQTLSQAPESQQ